MLILGFCFQPPIFLKLIVGDVMHVSRALVYVFITTGGRYNQNHLLRRLGSSQDFFYDIFPFRSVRFCLAAAMLVKSSGSVDDLITGHFTSDPYSLASSFSTSFFASSTTVSKSFIFSPSSSFLASSNSISSSGSFPSTASTSISPSLASAFSSSPSTKSSSVLTEVVSINPTTNRSENCLIIFLVVRPTDTCMGDCQLDASCSFLFHLVINHYFFEDHSVRQNSISTYQCVITMKV